MYSIVDIETTGGSAQSHKITEIAIINHDGERVVDSWSSLINPECGIPPWIQRLTGITNEMVENAPKFFEVAKKIVEMTEGNIFVAHNVRFDYEFIRKEFGELGYIWQRKKLCTVRLARKHLPGHASYSLGKLARDLNIKIEGRHRAMGDCEATVKVLDLILGNSNGKIDDEVDTRLYPPYLDKKTVEELPEGTGVYYFFDRNQKLLYVGKANNIKKRIHTHLSTDYKNSKSIEFKNAIADIKYELTGSEMMALLKECEEIKKLQPPFNRVARKTRYPYGIFLNLDNLEPPYIDVDTIQGDEIRTLLLSFTSKISAQKQADKMIKSYMLDRKLGPDILEQVKKKLMEKYNWPHSNCLILDKGRTRKERSYAIIKDNKLSGYGITQSTETWQILDDYSQHEENRDSKQILLAYLRKPKKNSSLKIHTFTESLN